MRCAFRGQHTAGFGEKKCRQKLLSISMNPYDLVRCNHIDRDWEKLTEPRNGEKAFFPINIDSDRAHKYHDQA